LELLYPAIKATKVTIVSYSLTNTHHIEVDWIKIYNPAILEQAKYWFDRSSPETLLTPPMHYTCCVRIIIHVQRPIYT